jgi:hypothetical protein
MSISQEKFEDIPKVSASEGPLLIEIKTVPPLEGIKFTLDGESFWSAEDGVAVTSVAGAGVYSLEVQHFVDFENKMIADFARWGDGVFTPVRELDTSSSISLEVGFHTSYPIRLDFIDLDGNSVPPNRITSVEIRNSLGDVFTFPGDEVFWFQGGNLLGRDYGLELVEVVQTVQSVTVDGSNVVNRGQQRFVVNSQDTPQIEILLYPANFKTTDAFFGFPVGRGILLQYPDGHEKVFNFDENNTLQIDSLARGTYRFKAAGVLGYSPMTVFVLSQPQEVSSIVISIWDLLVVLVFALIIFPGLLIIGRPEIIKKIRGFKHKEKDNA